MTGDALSAIGPGGCASVSVAMTSVAAAGDSVGLLEQR